VETRVQIPLGLRRSEAISEGHEGKWPRIGPAAYTGPSLTRSNSRPEPGLRLRTAELEELRKSEASDLLAARPRPLGIGARNLVTRGPREPRSVEKL
jgi:hypothetical protein